jgi:hypothetical protein
MKGRRRSERTLDGPRAAPFPAQPYRNRMVETKLVRRKTLEPTAPKERLRELLAWA